MEVAWLKHLVFLSKDEHDAPEVRDQPSVDRLVASVGRYEDVGDLGKKSLEGEFLQVCRKLWNSHILLA